MKTKLAEIKNTITAERATGIKQRGKLEFWSEGERISKKQAKKYIREGKEVAIPGAGAGNYHEVFRELGFLKLEPLILSSSAGDWIFGVKDKFGWRLAGQENRYPYYGFIYWIDKENGPFGSFEILEKQLKEIV
ncbi:hypothetical protein J7L36_02380 [bacterium]|nr:hypothetical protein [bacterium]